MLGNEYDKIKIQCCANCLAIDNPRESRLSDGTILHICKHCGHTEKRTLTIENWEELFIRKYNIGRYLDLPKEMTWDEIIQHENKETAVEENIRREIRNKNINI